jgi:hypothetical protein
MNYQKLGLAILAGVVLLGLGAGIAYMTTGEQAPESNNSTQPVSASETPDEVKQSLPAAKELKRSLMDEGRSDHNVSISPDNGEILVTYSSDASNGPALKEDMGEVAILYSEVVSNETGGLTVAANGVKLMVSSDAAIRYDEGGLKTNAFKKTFHWSSVSQNGGE